MTPRLFLPPCLAAGAAALLAVGACGDPTRPDASFETGQDTLVALALNGTPPGSASGLAVVGGPRPDNGLGGFPVLAQIDGGQAFDVAFDVDAAGNAVVYPLGLVAAPIGTTRIVGLQRVDAAYEAVTRAPGGRYEPDSALVVTPGQVFAIEAQSQPYCSSLGSFAQNVYAKVVVDSVRVATREIYFRVTVDPNCGFRSFAPGRPRD